MGRLALAFVMLFPAIVFAQEVKIDQNAWDELTNAQKTAVQSIVQQSFKKNITVSAVPGGAAPASLGTVFGNVAVCKAVCDVSALIANATCIGLGGPAAAVCAVVVAEGKKLCYADCDK